ncbi:MAG: ATP-binding cassette domain-containing protein [Gammaproteobacteria bacterium]|nr:ATP-binding cassette domain-containing protein [Gammaproteobacteria bacterium]
MSRKTNENEPYRARRFPYLADAGTGATARVLYHATQLHRLVQPRRHGLGAAHRHRRADLVRSSRLRWFGCLCQLRGAFARFQKGERDYRKSMEQVFQSFPRLRERRTRMAGTLSGGERAMLVLGRALMGKPKVLMLDPVRDKPRRSGRGRIARTA